jgi:hypothetical protein
MEDQLDLLAGFLLEGGDDLPDRIVFLGVVALVPPDDEIGGVCAQRRQNERQSNENGVGVHDRSSLKLQSGSYWGRGISAISAADRPPRESASGPRPAYRGLSMAGPLCGLQRSKTQPNVWCERHSGRADTQL